MGVNEVHLVRMEGIREGCLFLQYEKWLPTSCLVVSAYMVTPSLRRKEVISLIFQPEIGRLHAVLHTRDARYVSCSGLMDVW